MVKQLTEKRLYNITLFYLSKYEASSEKVRQMLNRRLMKMRLKGEDIPDSVTDWIEQVIQKMVSAGYINDQRYAENQVRILSAQGKSNRFIIGKLQQAGIDSETVAELLNQSEESESERARHFAKKKKSVLFGRRLNDSSIVKKIWQHWPEPAFHTTLCVKC